jgi:hypothetical protein
MFVSGFYLAFFALLCLRSSPKNYAAHTSVSSGQIKFGIIYLTSFEILNGHPSLEALSNPVSILISQPLSRSMSMRLMSKARPARIAYVQAFPFGPFYLMVDDILRGVDLGSMSVL